MPKSLFNRYGCAWLTLRRAAKSVVGFEFWFSLIYAVILAPLTAWLLNRLVVSSGQVAVSNQDLIHFFLSTQGVVFALLSLTFVLAFVFLEQVGLLIISMAATEGRRVSVSAVLWENLTHIPALIRLGLLQAMFYGLAALPFAGGGALTYIFLLGDRDINYYLAVQPWQWWVALVIAGVLTLLYLMVAAWLFVRWLFAIPALVFENVRPVGALKKSWQRTRHRFWALGVPQGIWWLFILLASFTTTWALRTIAAQLLAHAGLSLAHILPLVVAALAVTVIVDLTWFIVGKAVHALLIVDFYGETPGTKLKPYQPVQMPKLVSPSYLRKLAWIGVGVALVSAIAAGTAFIENLDLNRRIAVTAHRGSSLRAPENTMSALRLAVADGANYAEIDVQTTADGVVILMHDADLMRVASVNRKIQDIRYEELREIDIGSWFSPDFSNERTATLEEAMAFARGRIRLNIELKYNRPDPKLAAKVGYMVRRNAFAEACVITSLDYQELRKIKESFPEIKAGLIVFRALGNLAQTEADFLSIDAAQVTPRLVREAHHKGKEIHVWTVNDVQTTLAMIEVGADNIITDNPEFVLNVIRAWNDLSDMEKIALRLRQLFLEDDPMLVVDL
jgi:glycerophosphoryl diester phosphodiesterase